MTPPSQKRAPRNISHAKVHKLSRSVSSGLSSPSSTTPESSAGSRSAPLLYTGKTLYLDYKECEEDALGAMKVKNKESFTNIILRSPSPYSLKLGVLYAAKLNWCDALSLLLSEIKTTRLPVAESDVLREHPMHIDYFQKDQSNFAPNLVSKTPLEELAMMKAAVEGFVQVVEILTNFIGPNFGDIVCKPFLRYVYKNKDETSRRKCLQVVLPKLKPSSDYIIMATKNGDLPTVMYLVDQLRITEGIRYHNAVRKAIERGHDGVAKWLARKLDRMTSEEYEDILWTATMAQNYDLLVFFSRNIPGLSQYSVGLFVADALWKFLGDRDRKLFKKLVHGL
jgi:hypothetical protein